MNLSLFPFFFLENIRFLCHSLYGIIIQRKEKETYYGKNRLCILISARVAILDSLLPWVSLNAGTFGTYSVHGFNEDG